MTYIILSIIGILAVIAIKKMWKHKVQITFILLALVIGLVLYISIAFLFVKPDFVMKGGSLGSKIPWLEISLYFIMLVGMAAKYFFDAIGEGNKLMFQKWQFFKPMLVSPLVFGAIYGSFGENTSILLLLTFAFQNGFFWQTILAKKGA